MSFSGQPDWCQRLHWNYQYNTGLDQPQHQAWALIRSFLQETSLDNKFSSAPATCVHFLTATMDDTAAPDRLTFMP